MSQRKHNKAGAKRQGPAPTEDGKAVPVNAAFDIWLNRGLHKIYDDVAREPTPDALLRLIEEDRDK